MKDIYITLINFKNHAVTFDCLDSLLEVKSEGFRLRVVVVDNFPEDRIKLDESKYKKLDLKLILSPTNSGFSGGMNIGIKYALEKNPDYILVHNNDTTVKDDFLQKLFDFAEKTPDGGIFAPKIYFAKGYEFHKDRYKKEELGNVFWYAGGRYDMANVIGHHIGVDEVDMGQYDESKEVDFASGCSMLIKVSLLRKIGLFDEKYFLYYEDGDLSIRSRNSGLKVYYVPDSVVWHKNAGSVGGSGSKIQDYFISRNRMYFGMKYAPLRAKIALFRESLSILLKGREWQKKGVSDFFKGKMGRGSYF